MARTTEIRNWLSDQNARVLGHMKAPDGHITFYGMPKGKIILVHYYKDSGWEAYIPASDKNEIRATLQALDAYMAGEAPSAALQLTDRKYSTG